MKTLLARIKTALQGDATLSDYVNKIETVSPNTLPLLDQDTIPFIGLAPISSPEQWVAQRKEATHTVELYLVQWYELQEYAMIGDDDTAQKGLLDFVSDVESVVRGKFWASGGVNYLSKPTDIVGVTYQTEPWGDDFYVLIGTITLSCIRLFNA